MSNNRVFNLLISLGVVAVLLLGWFLGVSPLLDQVNSANTQTDQLKTGNSASEGRLATLKKQFANIGPLQSKLDQLQKSIPADADVSGFLDEINALCASTGVSLTSLNVNNAVAFVAAGSTAAAPDPAATTPPVGAAGGTATNSGTKDTSAGLIAIPIKINVTGSYAQIMAFTGALQGGTRLLFVSRLTLTGGTGDSSFTGALEGNIYALPLPPGVTPLPSPTSTPTPTPSPTPTGSATPGAPTPTPTPTP